MGVKLLYVSNGNIPSRWAHTVQTMKMAEALARQVQSFALLIGTDAMGWLRRRPELFEWYGIADPFRVRRLPVWWRDPGPRQSSGVQCGGTPLRALDPPRPGDDPFLPHRA
jgi:hypothetical protein